MAQQEQKLIIRSETEGRWTHHDARAGFFSILCSTKPKRDERERQLELFKNTGRKSSPLPSSVSQKTFSLDKLVWVLTHLSEYADLHQGGSFEQTDYWLSQALFYRPNRRAVNVSGVGLCWVDLDYYSVAKLRHLSPDEIAGMVLLRCRGMGIPTPSVILSSGRGLQLKWLVERLPKSALPRWNAVQRFLNEAFIDLGADVNARDISRVLRIAGTHNHKNGEMVHLLHVEFDNWGTAETPLIHEFDGFANTVLPFTREQLAEMRVGRSKAAQAAKVRAEHQMEMLSGGRQDNSNLRRFNPLQLSWDRLSDYRKLAQIRPVDKRSEGQTNDLIWLAGSALGMAIWGDVRRWSDEMRAVGSEIAPHWTWGRVMQSAASVRSRVEKMARGEWVEMGGKQYSPVYTPKNQTIIETLRISESEQLQLKTIISKDMAQDRARERDRQRDEERRRAAGVVPRTEYEAQAAERATEANKLRQNGLSIRTIADKMGISVGSVHGYLKKRSKSLPYI
jgi:hypothetical protein